MNSEPEGLEIKLTKFLFKTVSKPVYKNFADKIKLEGREQVLDFGAGMGTVAYFIAKRLNKGRLTCNNISGKWMIELKKNLRGFSNVEPLFGEIYSIGLEPATFDVVYSHFSLNRVSENDLDRVISHLVLLMKPDAKMYIREPMDNPEALENLLSQLKDSGLELESSQEVLVPFMGRAFDAVFTKKLI